MNLRSLGISIVVLLCLVLVAACSSGPAAAPAPSAGQTSNPASDTTKKSFEQIKADFAKIEEAANKEGKLTYYGPIENLDGVTKLWNAKYPKIQLEVVPARPDELLARIETEQATKNYVGDILAQTAGTHYIAKNAGYLAKTNLENVLPTLNDPSVVWAHKPIPDPNGLNLDGLLYNVFGIGINTRLVPPDKEPKTWKDLTDPYWKGKMLSDFYDRLGIGANWYVLMNKYPEFGTEYLDKMAKQEIKFMADRENLLARGEFALGFPLNGMLLMQMPQGTPVKFIFPEDGYLYSARASGILVGAPHPNAARVFLEFYLSKEAQEAATKEGRILSRGDVPHPFPDLQNLRGRKVLEFGDDWLAKQPQLIDDAKKRFSLK